MKLDDIKGVRFGRLVVQKYVGNRMWECRCDCGSTTKVLGYDLKNGKTRSCGCLRKEVTAIRSREMLSTHGMTGTRLYRIWCGMKSRCYYKNHIEYINYGGRGIRVCQDWESSFESFFSWAMVNGYSDNLTIDRIDNDGDYCPTNCRWSTYREQENNRRGLRLLTYKGETKTLSEWAKEFNMSPQILHYRISEAKWDIEKALHTEVKNAKPHRDTRAFN